MKNIPRSKDSTGRRLFLQRSLSLIPLVSVTGTPFSTSQAAEKKVPAVIADYVPQFFDPQQWAFINAAVDRLIPEDQNGAGAVSEGVPVYIDRQMELPYGYGHLWYMQPPFAAHSDPILGYQSPLVPRELYRQGIALTEHYCQQTFHKTFAQLATDQQDQVLQLLEKSTLSNNILSGSLFFEQLLDNTREGYLADPVHGGNQTLASWKLIGFPGARADYTDTVAQPNAPYPLGPVSISGKRSV